MAAKAEFPPELIEAQDRKLLALYRQAWDEGAARAGGHLTCRLGCTECCKGVFEISGLDAWRLRRGLAQLAARDPEKAREVADRAREQWALLAPHFPGDPHTGNLGHDDLATHAFGERFSHVPCPVLDPATGACLLYETRPLSCRSFGLPCRLGEEVLPPCRLNFVTATPAEVEAATVAFDPEDREGELLALLGNPPDTVVAAALALGFPGGSEPWE
ncbi:MAG: YkgJ family cysteine cluster protein [Thermoanaerobaculum sp.]